MQIMVFIFGEGSDLTYWQMGARSVVVFFIALLLIRISGRRSFGFKTPLDNIIVITLGAVLSRAIVGASPFVPVICSCLVIVSLHRFLAWIKSTNDRINRFIDGKKILLFVNGKFIPENLDRALVCKEDVFQGIRHIASTEDLSKIKEIYMERNGQISIIKKED